MCARISLKICEVLHIGIFSAEKFFTLFKLLRHTFVGLAISGIECLVIAVSASSGSYGSISIGTGKSGIDGNLLNFTGKMLF